jgi:hypothetical protein
MGQRAERIGQGAWGKGHRAWGMGQRARGMGHGSWGRAHRAWRVEQDDLKPEYLASVIWLRGAGYVLRVAGCEVRVTGCELRVAGNSLIGLIR